MSTLTNKFKEIIIAVLPFVVIVVVLSLFVVPLKMETLGKFIVGAVFIIIGMPIFLQGIDLSISPMGEMMSQSLIKTGSLKIVLLGSFIFGFIVTAAEPDMHVLARQVNAVTMGQVGKNLLIIVVSGGVGLLVSLGIFRMVRNLRLNRFLTIIYLIILIFALFVNGDYLAIAFDASGSTTGSITVPFLLALSSGIAVISRTKNGNEAINSFGLLGVSSTGAIVAVLLLGILSGNPQLDGNLPTAEVVSGNIMTSFLSEIPETALESVMVLLPVVLLMIVMNHISMKLNRRKIRKLAFGLLYTWIGLTFFLTGVNAGFIESAREIGYQIALMGQNWLLILVGIIFGIVTIPAEPSVHILTQQIEDETAGSIRAWTVMLTLSIGVGIAVGLSILRIILPELQLLHILLPGIVLSLILSYYIPQIFVGIAFDSGGVASGTMTATFILPFAQGVAERIPAANVVTDAFGVIALVAITPLITLQILGLTYKLKLKKAEKLVHFQNEEEGT
ncbi:MAG: DUF1538 domain-containing protein [Peptococcales bacterium]